MNAGFHDDAEEPVRTQRKSGFRPPCKETALQLRCLISVFSKLIYPNAMYDLPAFDHKAAFVLRSSLLHKLLSSSLKHGPSKAVACVMERLREWP